MVRIAETPEEWERIHRVLSLIGREKESYQNNKQNQKYGHLRITEDNENSMENDFKPPYHNRLSNNITNISDPESKETPYTTMSTVTTTPTLVTDKSIEASGSDKIKDTDTGWPDFEEAIVKKVKKSHTFNENDILETNWLEEDWLYPSLNNDHSNEKHKQTTSETSKHVPSISFKSTTVSKKTTLEKDGVPKSRLYRDPKILEFRLTPQNQTVEHNISEESNGSSVRGERPVFVYHRVTTSPQERRGNNAFIAVSVVRQSPAESSPPTTLPPHPLWDQLRRIQSPVKDSALPKHQRKHPHWRQETHWQHNRGRRHHHTHTHH